MIKRQINQKIINVTYLVIINNKVNMNIKNK